METIEAQQIVIPPKMPAGPGRPMGCQNHVSARVKEFISFHLGKYLSSDKFDRDFDALTSKDRISATCALLPFIAPRYTAVSVDTTITKTTNFAEELKKLSDKTTSQICEKNTDNN